MSTLIDEAQGVLDAHLAPRGATLRAEERDTDSLYVTVAVGGKTFDETILVAGMPAEVKGEYIHCRAHALAARVLAYMHPVA